MREMAYLEIAERLKESGKINIANIQDLLEPTILMSIIFPTFNVGCHKFQRRRKLDKFLVQITLSQAKICFSS